MIQISRILCPIDRSEHSQHALEHAAVLARWYRCPITALHVFARVPVAAYAPGAGMPGTIFGNAERQQILADLERLVDHLRDDRVLIVVSTRDGDPAASVVAEPREGGADLLVLGTHGRSGFERLFLGSVAEKVGAPLCHRDRAGGRRDADRGARDGVRSAGVAGALRNIHVEQSARSEGVPEPRGSEQPGTAGAGIPEAARNYCTVETMLAEGKPYREILRLAAERRCDLIVMGVRGRSRTDLALFGSTTQNVVRVAACPVLTLRGRERVSRRARAVQLRA